MLIETKVATGSAVGIVTGLVTWALVTFVPAFRTGLPPDLAKFLPIAVGWALSSAAAYVAPHTPREIPPIPGVTPPGAPQVQAGKDYIQRTYGGGSGAVSFTASGGAGGGYSPASGPAEPPKPPPGPAGASA